MPLSNKQFWKEMHFMSVIAKTSKILTNSDGVVLEDVLHFSNWLPDFLIRLLFLCFYPISSTNLLSSSIAIDQGNFWGSNSFWDQTTIGYNSRKKPIEKCLQVCRVAFSMAIAHRTNY
jgi:hypothetical protein